MSNMKKETIEAKGVSIQVYTEDFKNDYISLLILQSIKVMNQMMLLEIG